MILEFGVFTGGTLRRLAERFPEGRIFGFDSFEGIPEKWAKHPKGGLSLGGVIPDSVHEILREHTHVRLYKGLIENMLEGFLRGHPGPVDFVHVDVDVYSTTKFILDQLTTRIAVGTVIVFDEYHGYEGFEDYEFKAWAEWRDENPGFNFHPVLLDFDLGFNKVEEVAFTCGEIQGGAGL